MSTSEIINRFLEGENYRLAQMISDPEKKVKLIPTKELALVCGKKIKKAPEELTPMRWIKAAFVFFLLIDAAGFAFLINQFLYSSISSFAFSALSILALALFLVPVLAYQKFRKEVMIRKISSQGIFATDFNLAWNQLAETLIMKVPNGRLFKTYLVLVTMEDLILKYDLQYFHLSDDRLAVVIEFYKVQA